MNDNISDIIAEAIKRSTDDVWKQVRAEKHSHQKNWKKR
jgi:hypothetical protein